MTVPARGRTVSADSVGQVSKQAPHGFTVVTPDAEGLHEVAGSLGAAVRWRVLPPPDITQPVLVRPLAARGAPVLGFEPIKADLEVAFWNLAAAAKERRAA